MKIAVADLKLLMAWIGANSRDHDVSLKVIENTLQAVLSDANGQLAYITLFDSAQTQKPKLQSTCYLEHAIKKPT